MKRFCLIAFILCLTVSNAKADNISQIFDLAIKQDPELNAARANYKAEIEAKPQARALLLPNLSINASSTEEKLDRSGVASEFVSDSISLTLTQSVFNYGLFIKLRQASTKVKKAGVTLSIAYQDLIFRVAERYIAILTAIDQLEFARAEKRAVTRQLIQVQKRLEVGDTTITTLLEAKAARDLTLSRVLIAENELATRREALIELTNQPITTNLSSLKKEIPLITPQPTKPKQWTNTALQQNLAIKIAQFDLKTAKLEIRSQRSGHYPSLDIIASKTSTESGGGFFGQRDDDSEKIQLKLTIPLFSGGLTNSKVRQAKARYKQAVQNLEKQKRAVLRQTRDAYRGVISGISQVHALKQAIISSESALKASSTGYRVGTRNIVDVFNAQQDLYRAKSDYSQARNQYIINLLKLKKAAGLLSVNDLKKLNNWLIDPNLAP